MNALESIPSPPEALPSTDLDSPLTPARLKLIESDPELLIAAWVCSALLLLAEINDQSQEPVVEQKQPTTPLCSSWSVLEALHAHHARRQFSREIPAKTRSFHNRQAKILRLKLKSFNPAHWTEVVWQNLRKARRRLFNLRKKQ